MGRFETFSILIAKINRNVRKLKSREMEQFDLRSTHVQYIYHLYKERSLSLKQLSDICIADKAAVSRVIDELQNLGYVKKSDRHQYKHSYSLTKLGEEVGEKLSLRIDSVIEAAGSGLSDEERITFYSNLAKISENLQRMVDGN